MCSSFQIRCTRLMFTFQPPNTSEPVSTRCVRSLPCLGNVSTIFRHQRATRGRRLPSWDGDAACRGSGRAPDRPFFPRPFPAPRSAGRIPPSDGDARGTSVELRHASVWAGGLLEDQHVQGLVRHQLLQPRVLLLELLKLLGHLRLHPAATTASRRCPVRQRSYVCWLIPSRRQTSGTVEPFPRSTSACRSRPTICSARRRFFIREPFQAPPGARGFSHKTWLKMWGGGQPYPVWSDRSKPLSPRCGSAFGRAGSFNGSRASDSKESCSRVWQLGPCQTACSATSQQAMRQAAGQRDRGRGRADRDSHHRRR